MDQLGKPASRGGGTLTRPEQTRVYETAWAVSNSADLHDGTSSSRR